MSSDTATACARRGPGLQPRQERGQRARVERELVTGPAILRRVAQLQHDDLVGHDVELVAARRAPGDDFHTPSAEPAVRPQTQTGQPVERGLAAAVADHTVPPAVTSD